MSDFDDTTGYNDLPEAPAIEPEPAPDVADDGWTEVTATPPPEFDDPEPIVADLPPHETADTSTPPPGPIGDGELNEQPPAPVPTPDGLPPSIDDTPIEAVDLSAGEAVLDPAMPPVAGDTDLVPPGPGEVDLGAEGLPVPPDLPAVDPAADPSSFSPVPNMGGDTDTPIELGDDGPPLAPDVPAVDPAADPSGFSPVPDMGGDTDTPIDLGGDLDDPLVPVTEGPVDPDALIVSPGDERITAAALTGVIMDEMGYDDAARAKMIDLLEEAAKDGTITTEEVEEAMRLAGTDVIPVPGPTSGALPQVLDGANGGALAIATIEGEGTSVFRIEHVDSEIRLESVQSGARYVASPDEVGRAWRDSGQTVFAAPLAAPLEPPQVPAAAATPVEEGNDNRLRNALLAGAVLLPLAGGATYLATRKIR